MERNKGIHYVRNTVVLYYLITFIITILLGAGYQFTSNAFISPQYAPTIALLILSLVSMNWSAWSFMNWKPVMTIYFVLWIVISFFLPVLVIFFSSSLMSAAGIPFAPWQSNPSGYALTLITAILGCITEETGWRGYLLPLLSKRYNLFYSSIMTGLLWGAWHCKFSFRLVGFLLFVLLIICFSIIMTWIYLKTKGNLLCMILFHFGVNIGSVTFLQNREGVIFYGLTTMICILICIPIVITNKKQFFSLVKRSN